VAPIHRRWVFECDAALDHFDHRLRNALEKRGLALGRARVFDASVVGPGARAWYRLEPDAKGVALVAKVKGGVFASATPAAKALAESILAAGREAQAAILQGDERA